VNIAVITQPDSAVIPANIALLARAEGVQVRAIVLLEGAGAVVNRRGSFVRGFGVWQCGRLAVRLAGRRFVAAVRRLVGAPLAEGEGLSVPAVARRLGVPCLRGNDPNDPRLLDHLASLDLDLVVSFSAPVVFRERLLALPRRGCINLHCSLLPRYAGLLPSFWTLFHGENETGATVHFMDTQIDNGGILGQERVPIAAGSTMLDVIRTTKRIGGELMVRVVREVADGTAVVRDNRVAEGSYFGWPSVDDMRRFRRRGGRLA
jgi:methionyl-tRNA formyltransferase